MKVKILEVRDEGTMIPLLCVDMNPGEFGSPGFAARNYFLQRSGYPCDRRPNIAIAHLSCDGDDCSNDPYYWGGRTHPVAHKYIIENWEKLADGDVVDVQFILGETKVPKVSEREMVVR